MSLPEILNMLRTGEGQLIAAGLLFLIMWALKSIPAIEQRYLTTPRRRLAVVVFLAMAPAVTMLAEGIDPVDCLITAIILGASAMGIHTFGNVLQGKPVGVQGAPPAAGNTPPPMPPAVTGGLAVVVLALSLVGCAKPLETAINTANGAREVELVAGKIFTEHCTDALPAITTAQALAELKGTCVPARKVYGSLRTARLSLVAAITVAQAGGSSAGLLPAVAAVAGAAESAAATAAALEQ